MEYSKAENWLLGSVVLKKISIFSHNEKSIFTNYGNTQWSEEKYFPLVCNLER